MPKPDVNFFTGSVSINADVTPVTRQKIDQVSPEKWGTMTIEQLWDQRIILANRAVKALQSGNSNIAQQIQLGVNSLDELLRTRAEQAEEENIRKPNSTGFLY